MGSAVNPSRRPYNAPRRLAGAAETRASILEAAKARFERGGWAGTTIAAIAQAASVSPKTIEALFSTKAVLLATVVDYAIRGDASDVPIAQRELASALAAAPTAQAMLELHAAMTSSINRRSAQIAWVVEAAAPADEHVAELWQRMTKNFRAGVRWAAEQLLDKPGVRPSLSRRDAEQIFHVAMAWSTYRALNSTLGLTPTAVETWIADYYTRMFLP